MEDVRDLEVLLYQRVDSQVNGELCILDISLQALKPFIVFDLLSREVADHVADFLLDLLQDLSEIHDLPVNVLLSQVTELKQLLMLGIHLLIEVFVAFVELFTKKLVPPLKIPIKLVALVGDRLLDHLYLAFNVLKGLKVQFVSTDHMLKGSHDTHRDVIPLLRLQD